MNRSIRCTFAALMLGSLGGAAYAADVPPPAPVAVAPAFQPFQVRLRAVGVLAGGGGAVYTIPNGTSIANGIKASDAVIPELDVSYYFTPNLAIEAICCVSYHNLFLQGGALDGRKVAHVLLFPPTLLAQYHWTAFGQFQPYIGVGVNYTHYFSQHPDGVILNSITVHDAWGVAGQVGFDYMIDDHWGFNFDVKKIVMNPHVNATVAPGLVSLGGQANLNPWLIGAGITYRFGGPAAAVVAKY